MHEGPDYSQASLEDLLDVARRLDRERHPERWTRLQEEIAERRASPPVEASCSPHWRRLLIAYHIGLGLIAAASVFFAPSTGGIMVTGLIAVWSLAAGCLLWSVGRAGLLAALSLQILLVPQIKALGITIATPIGPLVLVGLLFPGQEAIHPFAGIAFQLGGGPPGPYPLGFDHVCINCIPLAAIVLLRRIRRGVNSAAIHAVPDPAHPAR